MSTVTDATAALRLQFGEMPGLALTPWQAQQLCRVPGDLSDQALRVLVASGFLRRTADGRYVQRAVATGAGALALVRRRPR